MYSKADIRNFLLLPSKELEPLIMFSTSAIGDFFAKLNVIKIHFSILIYEVIISDFSSTKTEAKCNIKMHTC